MKRLLLIILMIALAALLIAATPASAASASRSLNVNVLLNTALSEKMLKELGSKVQFQHDPRDQCRHHEGQKHNLQPHSPPYVAASPKTLSVMAAMDTVAVTDFSNGLSTWDLDAINVSDFGVAAQLNMTFCVLRRCLDTGLLDSCVNTSRRGIAEDNAIAPAGGGEVARFRTAQQVEHDQNSHGTHVTTQSGYSLRGAPVNVSPPWRPSSRSRFSIKTVPAGHLS
jgi:hypothetical protein